MKTTIIIFLLLTTFTVLAQTETETGTDPMGPPTMGYPAYPNSGEAKRSDSITGSGMSDATHMSSNVDPSVPDRNPPVKQKQEKETQTGPYKNGQYQFWDPNKKDSNP
jgi:hypothetical protein